MSLTRDQMLSKTERRYMDVTIPEHDGSIRIQSLTSKERAIYEMWFRNREGVTVASRLGDARVRLMISCVVDDTGDPTFALDDLPRLRETDAAIAERVYDAAWKHCGMESEAKEAAENFSEANA